MLVGGKLMKPLCIGMQCDGGNESGQQPSDFKEDGYNLMFLVAK